MPQLEFSTYISQLFWFLISFGSFLIFNILYTTKKINFLFNNRNVSKSLSLNEILILEKQISNIENEISQIKKEVELKISLIIKNKTSILDEKRAYLDSEIISHYKIASERIKFNAKQYKDSIQVFSKDIINIVQDKVNLYININNVISDINDEKRFS